MKFDIDSARKAGYSDDEIADYLATENKFDLGGAIKSGYTASDVIDFLSKPKETPEPAPAKPAEKGILDRVIDTAKEVGNAVLGRDPNPTIREGKSVMENYQPTAQEKQADVNRRLSYGAGPISSQTAAQADLVRSGMAKTDSPIVKKVAKAMQEQGTPSFGDMLTRAKQQQDAEDNARSYERQAFAEDSPLLAATASGAAQSIAGAINIPSVAADFLNQSAVNPVLRAVGLPELPKAPTMIGTEYLTKAAKDFMPDIGNKSMTGAWNRDEFGQWLGVKLAANSPQIAQSLAAAFAPPLRAVLLPSMGGTAAGQSYVGGDDSRVAVAKGALEYATEKLPLQAFDKIGDILKGMGPTKSSAVLAVAGQRLLQAGGDITAVGLTNAIEESAAQLGGNALDKYFQGKDVELTNGLAEAAVVGAATGKMMAAPRAIGTLAGAGDPASQVARAMNQEIANTEFSVPAREVAADLLNPNSYDQRLISPSETSRTVAPVQQQDPTAPADPQRARMLELDTVARGGTSYTYPTVGGESMTVEIPEGRTLSDQERKELGDLRMARTQTVNFTEPDSATAQAGLTPIVVPVPTGPSPAEAAAAVELPPINPSTEQEFGLDKLRMRSTNVSTNGAAGPATAGGGQPSGDLGSAGLGDAGLAGVNAVRGGGAGAAGMAPVGGETAPLGGATGQQSAGLTAENNNAVVQPTEQWFGRKGDGYGTEADAQQALPGRQRMFPSLDWKVEQMPSGKFRLAGYSQETNLGNQTTQAQQAEAQGQEAAGASAIAAPSAAAAPAPKLQDSGVQGLKFAPAAPLRDFAKFQQAVAADGIEIAPVRMSEMNDQHKVASLIARSLGKTYTVARVTSGDPMALSNGMIDKLGGKHIVAAENAEDAPLFVAIHEAYHGLPEADRKALNAQLLPLFKTESKAKFLKDFKYSEAEFEEEAPAFMAQVISKRADFWEELRTKMGDGEFAGVAKLILGSLNQILRKVSGAYGQDFADTYISDVVKARNLLTDAYTKAMREQGLQPDTAVTGGVVRSNKVSDINASLQQRIDTDFEGAAQEYAALKGTKGGRVLDTDQARELSPEYRADRTRSAEVHEAASDFIQREFDRRMATSQPLGKVVFMAGGGGSGKSSAETLLKDILDPAATIYDGTLSSYDKAERNIQMALDAGQLVNIVYVYREPEEALRNGVLTRAMRTGRTVPIDALVKGHAGSSEAVRKLQEKFGDNPLFAVHAVDNSRGPGNAVITDLQSITPVIKSGLKERFENATRQEYEAGRISDAVYRATAQGRPDARANGAGQEGDGRVRQEAQGEIQGRSGSERQGNALSKTRRGAERVGDFEVRTMKDGTIVVYGDPDAIRSQIPEDVKGRVTKDGIVFTTSAAPRVKAALEGRKTAYSRGGAVLEKLPMKDGKYIGAPEKFNTPGKIPTLRKWLRQLADEGAPGRYWYENSSREVLKMVGGDVQEARKFVALLAIYSPQAKVDANSTFALRAWAQYKAGQPISVKTGVMDKKAQSALDDVDAFWSGEKTGNFFFNLLREIDPSTAGKQGATIDMWMMRAGQYDTDAPTATQYAFMENETNRLAAELGWEPQQVQAAIWVAMKARMENSGVKKATEASSEKKGWIRYDYPIKNGRPVKTRVILNEKAHRDNWLKHSFEHDPTKDDTQQAKFDFGDGLKRHIGQISFEARPGRSTGVLPGIHDAPYAQQVEFQQAVQKAFYDEQGNDLLAMKLGLLVDTSDILLPGVWQGEVSPSSQKLVAMAPAKGDEGKTNVDPAQAEALNTYAAIAGLVAKQEGVGWHRPFYSATKRDSNGIEIDIGRPINPREASDLEKAIGDWMLENGYEGWQDQFAFISSPNGIRLVNFGIITNEKLHSDILSVAETVLPDAEARWFASSGDMMTNNWKEKPNGQDYVERASASGRSDVLEWTRDFLAPRVQRVFTEFSNKYGWGDPGEIRFSRRAGDGSGRQDAGRPASGALAAPERAVSQEALIALPGAPQVRGFTGPDPRLVSVAEKYARDNGITLRRQSEYVQVDEVRAKRIATAYALMKHDPQNPRVKEAYQNLIRQTVAQYKALEDAGYRFWFIDLSREDNQEYVSSPWNAMRDIRANQEMGVFPTADGFGTNEDFDPAQNPLLEDTGFRWPVGGPDSDRTAPVLANDLFRAVHDAFGHGLEGSGFRAQGEENAWQAHIRLFTGSAVGAITSETRGQNSWLNYGPHGEKNRTAKVEDTVFADQKTGLMPEWTWTEGRAGDMPEVMRSNRARESWFLGRDEAGRITLGAGAKAYRVAADLANNVLDRVGMKPISTDLGRAMRKMKVEIEQARLMTADAADSLSKLTEDERAMISDVIEGELKRGVKPPKRVLEVAASMQGIMSEQTAELVRLGMLSEEAAGRWDGKYLPRFYESKLKDEGKQWIKAAKAMLGRPRTMQGIKGSSLKGRGIFQTIPVEELEQWLAEGWEERDPKFNPDTDTEITIWRDYTREERENMGEIRDAMFRFIMGYTKSQEDIALGRLYEHLANTVASRSEQEGYVQVPSTNVEDTKARRYGKLAGKWVPQEVMDHLSATDSSMQSDLMKFYLKALSMWKEGKTVLNPVSHANNVISNLTAAHFAGVSYWDAHKYIGATRDLVKRSAMVQEAEDAGLFGGTMTQAELVDMMPDQLKVLAARTESKAAKGVDAVWNALSFWLRKPMGKAYQAEDLFFRYLIYRDARERGLNPDDAVDYAQKYIFNYDDLPKGARAVRNFALPFFSYTYKAVPMLAQTALETPWRYAAPAAVIYSLNAIMYAFAAGAGDDDDDWMSIIKRYITDPEFRDQARAMEEEERKNLPSWMRGASLTLGTSKAVRLGVDEATDLPVFLDVSRMFPGGDLFDAQNNAGGVPLLAPITPNNPLLTAASALLFNKDSFTGKEIVKKTDTSAEAAGKRAEWAWRQFTPAVAVGNYHFDRAMNVLANVTGEPVSLGFREYTGVGRDGTPVQPAYAAMQTVGIKARPIDLELSAKIDQSQTNAMIRDIDAEIRGLRRLANKGAISDAAMEKETDKLREKRQRLKEGLTVEGEEKK